MDEACDFFEAFRRKGVGVHLEGRDGGDAHIPFADGALSARTVPAAVPHDLVKGGAAHFRPKRRARNDAVEVEAPFDRL